MSRILIVDDEVSICTALGAVLATMGHQVETAESGEVALTHLRKTQFDIMMTDLRMDGMSGIDLLSKVREYFPAVTSVIMTAYGTIDTAVQAMRFGAYDFLVKPFTPDQIEALIRRMEEFRRLRDENRKLKEQVEVLTEPESITSRNPRMLKVLETAKKVAASDSTILITGESGTGKTLLAKVIHDGSPRAKGPFAVVNCATLSENLLESELFGHVRGSFTGAVKDKVGRLQVADTGTVFLDEIGEISPALQTKLLRFLQEREFERVGDTRTIKVDVRIIAATNKDLEREVAQGRFREDLYFRLNVIELQMPSLRQRKEDLPALADGLLQRAFVSTGRPLRALHPEARDAILAYHWPGNIRELKNALERAAILCSSDVVGLEDLPDRVLEGGGAIANGKGFPPILPVNGGEGSYVAGGAGGGLAITGSDVRGLQEFKTPSDVSLEDLERQHIQQVLASARTLEEAATTLGINLSTLWRKRRRYQLD
jgi:DNA-binding NtrC family response regulator